jgi:hypothetical protein
MTNAPKYEVSMKARLGMAALVLSMYGLWGYATWRTFNITTKDENGNEKVVFGGLPLKKPSEKMDICKDIMAEETYARLQAAGEATGRCSKLVWRPLWGGTYISTTVEKETPAEAIIRLANEICKDGRNPKSIPEGPQRRAVAEAALKKCGYVPANG